jgi:hypothetical protein
MARCHNAVDESNLLAYLVYLAFLERQAKSGKLRVSRNLVSTHSRGHIIMIKVFGFGLFLKLSDLMNRRK